MESVNQLDSVTTTGPYPFQKDDDPINEDDSGVLPKLLGSKSNQAKISIINDISGIANAGRWREVLIQLLRRDFSIDKCPEKLIGLKAVGTLHSTKLFFVS
ncbi:hypothetical protein Patl1_24200 [Pistacia atlantica]|uniref:Uncharacterized protein n=1 Tax=Pistacia atlantica TaxID=434234 RepID=A0ACC0ZVF3_9ROSI|nr:hypothetical protein Patl1_24200 [Pistacia atlantica]